MRAGRRVRLEKGDRMRAIACAGLCAVLLALAVGAADASTWYTSPSGTQSAFGNVSFRGGEITLACNITLVTTFASSFAVTSGATAGSASGLSWRSCTEGEIETVLGLPWTIAYSSLSGTTPEGITKAVVGVRRFSLELATFGGFLSCLYQGELEIELVLNGIDDYSVSWARPTGNAIALVSGFGCPSEVRASGTLAVESLWRWIFAEPLPVNASKPFLRREASLVERGGQEVTFSEAGAGARRPTTGRFRRGGTGWTTNFEECFNKTIEPATTCTMTFRALREARSDQFRILEGETVIAKVSLDAP